MNRQVVPANMTTKGSIEFIPVLLHIRYTFIYLANIIEQLRKKYFTACISHQSI